MRMMTIAKKTKMEFLVFTNALKYRMRALKHLLNWYMKPVILQHRS